MSEALPLATSGQEVKVADEQEARQLVEQIKKSCARVVEQAMQLEVDKEDFGEIVAMAYRQRVWITLGYESWGEMAQVEFSNARFFESITARRDRVKALVAEGLSMRAVGDVLGSGKDRGGREV